jgi:serine/threonine-protein kinase
VVGDFGEVYVLDWGVARMIGEAAERPSLAEIEVPDAMTVVGAVLGTPGYMSPEQVAGEVDIDGRSDVYALGSILFEILAFTPLHERGDGLMAPLIGIDARPSVRAPGRDIPPELDTIRVTATALDRSIDTPPHASSATRFNGFSMVIATSCCASSSRRPSWRLRTPRSSRGQRDRAPPGCGSRCRARLALDPTNPEPAELVGRLMLEPPTEVPRDVELAIETRSTNAMYAGRRLMIGGAIAYAAFLPILFWLGFRDPVFIVTGGVTLAIIVAAGWLVPKRWEVPLGYLALASNALVIALFAWAFTPFLIAPTLGVVTAMALATHPRIARPGVLVAVIATAVLSPFVLELIGVIGRSTFVVGGLVLLRTTAGRGFQVRKQPMWRSWST